MMIDGAGFSGAEVEDFLDWGTLDDWSAFRARFCTLFIDLDGTLVKNSAEYFSPFWGDTDAIEENVSAINALYDSGYGEIVITTTRNSESEEVTRAQLSRIGLRYHRLMLGLFHGKRIVINDYARTNPYRSCDAINIPRDSSELTTMLRGLVRIDGDE